MAALLNLGGLLGGGSGSGGSAGTLGLPATVESLLPGAGGVTSSLLAPVAGPVDSLQTALGPVSGLVGGGTGLPDPMVVIDDANAAVAPVLSGLLGQMQDTGTTIRGLLDQAGSSAGDFLSGLYASVPKTDVNLGDLLGGNGGAGGITTVNIIGGTSQVGTSGNDFLQGGAGNDKLYGGAGDDIIDGAAGFDIGIYQGDRAAYTISGAAGARTIKDAVAARDGTDTLRNMEFLQFRDGGVDLATNTFVPQATLDGAAVGYRGVVRLDAPLGVAETIGSGLAQGKFTFDAYVDALIKAVDQSTIPALLMAGIVTGTVPTSEKLDALAAFAQTQYDYYNNVLGSASPQLGPYEALGRGFAATPEFKAKYGGGTDDAFITKAYSDVFGASASSAQQASLLSQVNFFETLYKGAGFGQEQVEVMARGAVFGQIVGYAAADLNETYHATAEVLLTGFANGDTTHYGAAFG